MANVGTMDELERYLEQQSLVVAEAARARVICWLEVLRNLRASASGVSVAVVSTVEKDALDELQTELAQRIVRGWGGHGYTRAALADEADRCNCWFEALRELRATSSDVSVEVVGTVDEVVRRIQGGQEVSG